MDFTSIWEYIAGRNPMFLAASGSVTLGVTLILAAGIVQLKRFRARARYAAQAEIPAPAVPVEKISEPVPEKGQPVENPELRHLLARLRAASDKLERKRAADAINPPSGPDSPLKRSPSGVDYIFRAGTG